MVSSGRRCGTCGSLSAGYKTGVVRSLVFALVFALQVACGHPARPVTPLPRDPSSFADPAKVAITHVSLDLTVDFTARVLHGTAKLTVARHDPKAPLRLDTQDLAIESAVDCATSKPLAYAVDRPHTFLGSQLVIQQPSECVAIAYRTSPGARALLWMEPSGTAGKQAPMLFTQSQAILARSWVPLQDTPSVRFTYDAVLHVPAKLWAVMSATNLQRPPADGVWHFEMKQPIPSYLMALAVGDFAFKAIGTRTGIYAEPSIVEAAAAEFGEVDAMMATAEKLYGPYAWGRYDMLVLPPSFPYGGMENPRLTFLTPTAIVGDRTLVSLIAHELAHSWSGNLVTNRTWADFWLNEGFTTYVERRIMEQLRGRDYVDMQWSIGHRELLKAFAETKPADTRLALEISPDRDPEDVPGNAAYEKGALFLRTLEEAFGRDVFDAFVRRRFERLAFSSTDSVTFEADVRRELIDAHPGTFTVQRLSLWLHGTGLPDGAAPRASRRVAELDTIAQRFLATGELFETTGWSTLDWVVFLRALPATLVLGRLHALDAKFRLTAQSNPEIAMNWLPLMVRADGKEAIPAIEAYLTTIGRRRNLGPLYKALVDKGGSWLELARATFEKAKPMYHPTVREDFTRLLAR